MAFTYAMETFGSWAEYGDEVTTRAKQARRLGRNLADLVWRKRSEGGMVKKVEWFEQNDFTMVFPRIGWKLRVLVPIKEPVS